MTMRETLYIDMDNVLVDFVTGIARLDETVLEEYEGRLDEVPGIFALMDPMPDAIESFKALAEAYDTYILSSAPWRNSSAWSHKVEWVQRHLGDQPGDPAYKRLILSHHKHLSRGDILVDDRTHNGADRFDGEFIQFGTPKWPNWDVVTGYLLTQRQRKL